MANITGYLRWLQTAMTRKGKVEPKTLPKTYGRGHGTGCRCKFCKFARSGKSPRNR